jgi:hypothetical protein
MRHPLQRARERTDLRRTLIHEFGHALVAHRYGVTLHRVRVLWATRGQAFPNLTDAINAAPLRDWRSIYITIAIAGVVAEQMSTIAQPTPDTIFQGLTTERRQEQDALAVERAFERSFTASDIAVLVGYAKASLRPHLPTMIEVAERQAEVHVWGPDRAYDLDGAALIAALTGETTETVAPQYDEPRYRWA